MGRATRIVFRNKIFNGNFKDVPAAWMALRFDALITQPGSGGEGFAWRLPFAGWVKSNRRRVFPPPTTADGDFWGNKVPEGKCPFIGSYEKP